MYAYPSVLGSPRCYREEYTGCHGGCCVRSTNDPSTSKKVTTRQPDQACAVFLAAHASKLEYKEVNLAPLG